MVVIRHEYVRIKQVNSASQEDYRVKIFTPFRLVDVCSNQCALSAFAL